MDGTSWLLGDAISNPQLTKLIVPLHVIAGIAMLVCAIAIGMPSLLPGWWQPLAIAGAVFGIVAFAVFWDGQTRLLFDEGAVGEERRVQRRRRVGLEVGVARQVAFERGGIRGKQCRN